jgi:hypothetical protein
MCMLILVLIPYLNSDISRFTQASFSEFVIDGHSYTSPNQQKSPPIVSSSDSESLSDPVPPTQLRKRVWALQNHPYLPFILNSPFHGVISSRLATPPEQIHIEKDSYGFHLPDVVAKSWKTLEQSCRAAAEALRSYFTHFHPKISLVCVTPNKPSEFGYFVAHSSEYEARSALSKSLDAFVILFAYLSFLIALARSPDDPHKVSLTTTKKPRWLEILSHRRNRLHPEWIQLLVDSPIADFTTGPQRLGAIVNVARCSWIHLVPYMLKANVPIWLYWGIPPAFAQPLDDGALRFAPRSHPQARVQTLPVIETSQPVASCVPSAATYGGPGQLPGETWKEFLIRQNCRRKEKLKKENDAQRQVREGREMQAAKMKCPGKKGPSVYIWEDDDGAWSRTLLTRGQVEGDWGNYRKSQRIFNSIDNCWDLCYEFDEGTLGEVDDDDSGDDVYPDPPKKVPGPTLFSSGVGKSGDGSDGPSMHPNNPEAPTPDSVSMPAQVAASSSHLPHPNPRDASESMLVDRPDDFAPVSVSKPAQVVASSHDLPHPLPQDSSDGSSMLVDRPNDFEALAPLSASTPAQVVDSSRHIPHPNPPDTSMLVDRPSDFEAPAPLSVSTQVLGAASSCDLPHPNPQSEDNSIGADEDDEDDPSPYDASRQDVLNAYLFVPLDLEQMPITTLGDLLYYRYGFSLNEDPYTGIPASFKAETHAFRSWTEICRAVGGQHLNASADDRVVIDHFLSILAGCENPFNDVPGKYWDLSPLGHIPLVNLTKVFISIEERQFTGGVQYIIHPRSLHPDRDAPWLLSVDPLTALECIRRGLGPHRVDIAKFLISHGVHFRTLQLLSNSPEPCVRPQCRYLGYRPVDYRFDLADFAGYEALCDSFLRSQPHGPLALREGGIIARLAREVLSNSDALLGPSSEALSGRGAKFVYNDKIYVEDTFSEAELGLICGTYTLSTNARRRRMRTTPPSTKLLLTYLIFPGLPKRVSWFPPPNIWNLCGFNVGQWTEECEIWFQEHVSNIHRGTFQPLSSKEWRDFIRNTRVAVKLTYQMKAAAAKFISAQQ